MIASLSLRYSLNGKPFVLIFLIGLLCSLFCFVPTRSVRLRRFQLFAASSFLSMFLLEAMLIGAGRFGVGPCGCRLEGDCSLADYYDVSSDLSYRAVPGARVNFRKICGTRPLYDVVYTIDEHGQRKTDGNRDGDTILFFGGSFTFGEGVNDDETLPAVSSRRWGFRYNVVNFGFHGWEPHQMLRILQTNREEARVTSRLRHVVYVTIHDHVRRCAEGAPWDPSGPKYALDSAGKLAYRGRFKSGMGAFLVLLVNRSWCGDYALRRLYRSRSRRPEDYEVFAEIVAKSGKIVNERYGAPFTVLVWWGTRSPARDRLLNALRDRELDVIDGSDFVAADLMDELRIAPRLDGHPNRLAFERMAPKLLSRISPSIK